MQALLGFDIGSLLDEHTTWAAGHVEIDQDILAGQAVERNRLL